MFCGRAQDAHPLEIAQYADFLIEQTYRMPEPVHVATRGARYNQERRENSVTTMADQALSTQ